MATASTTCSPVGAASTSVSSRSSTSAPRRKSQVTATTTSGIQSDCSDYVAPFAGSDVLFSKYLQESAVRPPPPPPPGSPPPQTLSVSAPAGSSGVRPNSVAVSNTSLAAGSLASPLGLATSASLSGPPPRFATPLPQLGAFSASVRTPLVPFSASCAGSGPSAPPGQQLSSVSAYPWGSQTGFDPQTGLPFPSGVGGSSVSGLLPLGLSGPLGSRMPTGVGSHDASIPLGFQMQGAYAAASAPAAAPHSVSQTGFPHGLRATTAPLLGQGGARLPPFTPSMEQMLAWFQNQAAFSFQSGFPAPPQASAQVFPVPPLGSSASGVVSAPHPQVSPAGAPSATVSAPAAVVDAALGSPSPLGGDDLVSSPLPREDVDLSSEDDEAEEAPKPSAPATSLEEAVEILSEFCPDSVVYAHDARAPSSEMGALLGLAPEVASRPLLKESLLTQSTLEDVSEQISGHRKSKAKPRFVVEEESTTTPPSLPDSLEPRPNALPVGSFIPAAKSAYSHDSPALFRASPIQSLSVTDSDKRLCKEAPNAEITVSDHTAQIFEDSARRMLASASVLDRFLIGVSSSLKVPGSTPFLLREEIDVDALVSMLAQCHLAVKDIFAHGGTLLGNAVLLRRDILLSSPSLKVKDPAAVRSLRSVPVEGQSLFGLEVERSLCAEEKRTQRDVVLNLGAAKTSKNFHPNSGYRRGKRGGKHNSRGGKNFRSNVQKAVPAPKTGRANPANRPRSSAKNTPKTRKQTGSGKTPKSG